MARKKNPDNEMPLRYRVTVPLKDTDVVNWMATQSNVSFSVRLLIRAFIAKYGITDVTCLPVSPGLELDISGPVTQPAQTKKSSTSLTEIRQSQAHMQVPAQAQPAAQPVQITQPAFVQQPPASAAAPVAPAPQPVKPAPTKPSGYVPADIPDLM